MTRVGCGLFALVLIGAVACSRHERATVPRGDCLRLAGADEVPTLDPALGYDDRSWTFELLIFETLLDYGDGVDLVPRLASRYALSEDSRRIELWLRPGARFSNGREISSSDVRFAIERVLKPATHSPGAEFYLGISGAKSFVEGRAQHVDGIDARDPGRLVITLDRSDALFPHKLAMPFAAPVPQEEVDRLGADFGRSPTGSGPFRVAEWRAGERLRLERVAGETRGVRFIERLAGVGDQLAWLKFESGELDVSPIPPAEFSRVMRDPAYAGRIVQQTLLSTRYLGLNTEVSPFDHVAVRQAIAAAIDRRKVLALVNGRGEVASSILPPGMPAHHSRPVPEPDPETARRLLASAGLDAGFTTTLWVQNDPVRIKQAEGIAQDLAQIGVTLRIKPVTWAALLEAVRTAKLVPLVLFGWQADFPDPVNFLEVLFHSRARGNNNSSFFSSPEIDVALDAAAPLPTGPERLAAYARIEAEILEAAPWVPLYHPANTFVLDGRVRGFHLHPMRPERLEEVWLE